MTSRTRTARRGVAVLLLAVLAWSAQATEPFRVDGAWSRALPPVVKTGAAYFTVHNVGTTADVLIGASASIAERAELHTHVHADGMMRMQRVERIDLQPGGAVAFEPHGLHVMLFGLRQPMQAGTEYRLKLHFESGATHAFTVKVLTQAP